MTSIHWVSAVLAVGLLLGASPESDIRRPELAPSAWVESDTLQIYSSNDLIGAILASNKSYEAFQLRAEATEFRTHYAATLPDPMISVSGQPLPVYTARGKQVAGLRVEQTIPFPGKRDVLRQIAELETAHGQKAANHFVVDVILEAQLAFIEVLHGQQLQQLIRSFTPRLDEMDAIATSKYEGGEGTQQNLFKIQLEKARLEQMWLEQQRLILSKTAQIQRLVQQPIRIQPTSGKWENLTHVSLELESRSDLQMLETTSRLAEQKIEWLSFYNKPDFTLSINWIAIAPSDMPPTSDGRDALALGVGVRIPLWPSGNKARLQEAELQVEAAQAEIEAKGQNIMDLFNEVRATIESDQSILKLIESSLLTTAGAVSESAISAYSTGLASFMDLLDAERSLFQLQMDLVHVQARIQTNTLLLNRISGRLNRAVSELNQ